MPLKATMSLLGLYEFDKDLFTLMKYPSGFSDDDKITFINNLLAETANLQILYPDPGFMREMIGAWSKKQLHVWEELYKTLSYDYDPIMNYDRHEESTDTYNNSHQDNGKADRFQAAYNSPMDPDNLPITDRGTTENGARDNGTNRHTMRAYGNIGTTTTQKMISEQREVVMFNIYDEMIKDFRQRFCLLVY